MNDQKILFINSFQRSGSTLLGMLLDRHPAIAYLGEVRNVHEYLEKGKTDFSGELLMDSEFWQAIFDRLPGDPRHLYTKVESRAGMGNLSIRASNFFSSGFFDKLLALISPRFRAELRAYDNIRKYYKAAAGATDCEWLVDSSHRTSEARNHLQVLQDRLKVVFLARDGRGVVNSVMKRTGINVKSAARQWKRFTLLAQRFHATLSDDQYLFVRYEDLCRDLPQELARIAGFLGVESFDHQMDQAKIVHHFVGGSSTLRERSSEVFTIRLDEKWRLSMRQKDLAAFEKIAGDVNRSLGYNE
jgi:hypothetical protein